MAKSRKKANRRARVLIVDDHPAVREALALRVNRQTDLEVCGEAEDTGDALKMAARTQPDVAVIDISLKTGNGLDLIKRLKARNAALRMLVWSMHSESLYAERTLRAGALGYITKEQATDEIVAAIRQVLAGKVFLSPTMTEKLLGRVVGEGGKVDERQGEERLSDREVEVFQSIGRGKSTTQIAADMHVSPKTVETYRVRIKDKLGCTTLAELIQRAVQWVDQKR